MGAASDSKEDIPDWVPLWLSQPRLESYVNAAGPADALERYAWNCRASAVLFELIGWFEVAWRNNIDRAICSGRPSGAPHWLFDASFPLRTKTWEKVAIAKDIVAKRGKEPSAGQVIAELSLGFWRLTAHGYWTTVWRRYLSHAFPHAPGPPKAAVLDRQLDRIIKLRNRIAHHEPIGRVADVRCVVDDMLAIGYWINPEMAAWWRARTDVPRVLGNGAELGLRRGVGESS